MEGIHTPRLVYDQGVLIGAYIPMYEFAGYGPTACELAAQQFKLAAWYIAQELEIDLEVLRCILPAPAVASERGPRK